MFGAGISATIESKSSPTPSPVRALVHKNLSGSMLFSAPAAAIAVPSGSACSTSTFVRTGTIGRPSLRAAPYTPRVCACTPRTASIASTQPSTTRRVRATSLEKSECPGVSTMFRRWRRWGRLAAADFTVMPRRRSTGRVSSRDMFSREDARRRASASPPPPSPPGDPEWTYSWRREARDDFPWSTCAMMQKFRTRAGSKEVRGQRRGSRESGAAPSQSSFSRSDSTGRPFPPPKALPRLRNDGEFLLIYHLRDRRTAVHSGDFLREQGASRIPIALVDVARHKTVGEK
mmetsp:Transcript_39776/g.93165  ORF Transcript_39776/g.93165 Transcript_39776/m.93165 type:complete len:289 (+) Transcript_39776:1699-2565(+)